MTGETSMLKKSVVVTFFVLLFVVSLCKAGEGLIPPVEVGDNIFRLSLYNGVRYDSSRDDKTYWGLSRFRVWWNQEKGPWYGLFEGSVIAAGERDDNWLRMAWVGYKFNPNWQIRIGRLGLSPDQTPPFFLLETINYPRYPYRCYGWGGQVEGKLGNGWTLFADISGPADKIFDSRESWDWKRPVFGARLTKDMADKLIGRNLVLGWSAQGSDEFRACAFDFDLQATERLGFRGMAYLDKERGQRDTVGAWLLGVYKLSDQLKGHLQYDWQRNQGSSSIVTAGLEFWPFQGRHRNRLSFTADYEKTFGEQGDDDRVMFRIKFGF